jgi:hypothetical protein
MVSRESLKKAKQHTLVWLRSGNNDKTINFNPAELKRWKKSEFSRFETGKVKCTGE